MLAPRVAFVQIKSDKKFSENGIPLFTHPHDESAGQPVRCGRQHILTTLSASADKTEKHFRRAWTYHDVVGLAADLAADSARRETPGQE
jgi:hypothetical protein